MSTAVATQMKTTGNCDLREDQKSWVHIAFVSVLPLYD